MPYTAPRHHRHPRASLQDWSLIATGSVLRRPWFVSQRLSLALQPTRLRDWPGVVDGMIVMALLGLVSFIHVPGMYNNPSMLVTDDEGTYVAQAWALINWGQLAHYTYWYDHPPVGWLQIAVYAALTNGFDRHTEAVALGREVMFIGKLATAALLYGLARRIGLTRACASLGVVLFALNPLALYFSRITFLDNLALPWALAAFYLAASPRQKLGEYAGAGLCFGVAVLTKETILVILPALLYQFWQASDRRNRSYGLTLLILPFGLSVLMYPIYAALNGELFPGLGHVDLVSAIEWQLFARADSGSIFESGSGASYIVRFWAQLDPWLLTLGIASIPLGIWNRPLRPVTVALNIQLIVMLRGGYLPQPYVIAILPFATLVFIGTINSVWASGRLKREQGINRGIPLLPWSYREASLRLPVIGFMLAVLAFAVIPQWWHADRTLMTVDRNTSFRQTIAWVEDNVPKDATMLIGDTKWVDLVDRGFDPNKVIWYFKADLDPEVAARIPRGWRDVDYVILNDEMANIAESQTVNVDTTIAARNHSEVVASFGSGVDTIRVYRVDPA